MRIDIAHRSFEETLTRCAELGGVDLIFTSPPYPTAQVGAKGREGAPTRDYGGDAPKHFTWPDYQRLGDYCFRALKPGGFCIVIVDGPVRTTRKGVGSERSLIAFELAIDWAKRVGFRYVEHEVYSRQGVPGDFYPRRRSGWEPMHVLQRPGARGWFDAWAGAKPSKSAGVKQTDNARGSTQWRGRVYFGTPGRIYRRGPMKTLTTIIEATGQGPAFNRNAIDVDHPAPFTEHVARVQVKGYSAVGGIVCDPFNGSGTTGIAAARHGRSFIGGDLGVREKDGRRWADIGRERAEEAAREFACQTTEQLSALTQVPSGSTEPVAQGSLFK